MPPRRQPARRSKRTGPYNVELSSSGDEFEHVKPGPSNRRQTVPKNDIVDKSRGRGKLRMLPEMPLDILFEIFGLLDPEDVLRLSRTTKALRDVLMSRSAISVWRTAFRNDPDLPPCPEDLTEPQYANLTFSEHCHYCLSPGAHNIMWVHRARCCEQCKKKRYGEAHEVSRKLSKKSVSKHMDLLSRAQIGFSSWLSYAEASVVDQHLTDFRSTKERDTFIEARKEQLKKAHEHAAKCEASIFSRTERRLCELDELHQKRREEIYKRLGDLGFEDEVKYLNGKDYRILAEHASINQVRELTDRVWTNMKPTLVDLMKCTREEILRKRRKGLLKQRLRVVVGLLKEYVLQQPFDEIMPSTADLCSMPLVQGMLDSPSLDAYITPKDFVDLVQQLPQLCTQWRYEKNAELLALMPPLDIETLTTEGGPIRLELATTFFKCTECIEPISYPRILAHGCLTALRHGYRNREDSLAFIFNALKCEPWNSGNMVSYSGAAEAAARVVLKFCGFDPDEATPADLDEADEWMECSLCNRAAKERQVFKWRKAILHEMNHAVTEPQPAQWDFLDDNEAEVASKRETESYKKHYSNVYCCVICLERMGIRKIEHHVLYHHNVQDAQEGRNYFLHPDASIQPPFAVTIS